MDPNSLSLFCSATHREWGPLSSELVRACRDGLAALTRTPPSEPWLAALHAERPASRELYRDEQHGFMLLAHTESEGLYRPPHDHGRAWVVYAVQSGELEIGSYVRVEGSDGRPRLVRRDVTILRPGEGRAYLPGDIHDTQCLTKAALLFRFTERDLRHEDQVEHRVTRYVKGDGYWTTTRP